MLMVILHISLSVIKLKLDQNEKKLTESTILSRTKGKHKNLMYSVFLTKRMDELSSKQMCTMNYLVFAKNNFSSSRTHSWRGFPTLRPLLLATPSIFQIVSKKYINQVTHSLSSANISIFYRKSTNFTISRNTDIVCILIHYF